MQRSTLAVCAVGVTAHTTRHASTLIVLALCTLLSRLYSHFPLCQTTSTSPIFLSLFLIMPFLYERKQKYKQLNKKKSEAKAHGYIKDLGEENLTFTGILR
jgi:hypothetical protein